MQAPFTDRSHAGRALAGRLEHLRGTPGALVLGLPRGGIPVAREVAEALGMQLDALVVRKLGVPWHPELAMGAVASGGAEYLDRELIRSLGISDEQVEKVIARERGELDRRERLYRAGAEPPALSGRTVILVDDGLATGSTMRAAVQALRRHGPAHLVVAVPVASMQAAAAIRELADEFVAVRIPEHFNAVGQWYGDFDQTSDKLVRRLLAQRPGGK